MQQETAQSVAGAEIMSGENGDSPDLKVTKKSDYPTFTHTRVPQSI